METMIRKEWGSPKGNVQEFTPQEFVAACYPVENLGDGTWYVDVNVSGNKMGIYDMAGLEHITGGWAPGNYLSAGGSYACSVYRWCDREKDAKLSSGSYTYDLGHTNHRWRGVPTNGGSAWGWYDGLKYNFNYDVNVTNDMAGHFVLAAESATLKISANGNRAVIIGSLLPEAGGGAGTSAAS